MMGERSISDQLCKHKKQQNGISAGYGFVDYYDHETADRALTHLNGTKYQHCFSFILPPTYYSEPLRLYPQTQLFLSFSTFSKLIGRKIYNSEIKGMMLL